MAPPRVVVWVCAAFLALAVLGCVWLWCSPMRVELAQRQAPIPAILHQTWKSADNIPTKSQACMASWKKLNPTWEFRFYDDKACMDFVAAQYPQYLKTYQALELPVQRADLFRYMVIYHYGGFYADLDTTCRKTIEPLREHGDGVVGVEFYTPWLQYLQWFFGAKARNPCLQSVLDVVMERLAKPRDRHPDLWVLYSTGPHAFTEGVRRVLRKEPHRMQVHDVCEFGAFRPDLVPGCEERAYLSHHFEGSWKVEWSEDLKNE